MLKVEKYDDRFVLSNPGLLKLPLPTIYKGGESRSRNPRMQTMLRMVGYGENIGTGFATIVKTWDTAHWMRPQLREDAELMKIELSLWQKQPNVTDNLGKNVGDNVGDNNGVNIEKIKSQLTSRQKIILGLVAHEPEITAKEMSVIMSVTKRTIERDIAHLQELKALRHQGPANAGYWEVLI